MYIIYNILKVPSFDLFNALIVSIGLSTFGVYEKFLILSTFFWIYSNYNPTFLLNRIYRFNVIKKSFKLIDNDELHKTNKTFYYINYVEDKLNKTVNYIDNLINININIFNKFKISTIFYNLYALVNERIDIYINSFVKTVINVYNNLIYNMINTSKKNKFTIIKKEMEEFNKLKQELEQNYNRDCSNNDIINNDYNDNIDINDTSIEKNMKDVENILNEINQLNVDKDEDLDEDNKKNNINKDLEFIKNINFKQMFKEIFDLKDNKLKTQINDLIKKDV